MEAGPHLVAETATERGWAMATAFSVARLLLDDTEAAGLSVATLDMQAAMTSIGKDDTLKNKTSVTV